VNPKSTSNQSSKPCTVLQNPSRKIHWAHSLSNAQISCEVLSKWIHFVLAKRIHLAHSLRSVQCTDLLWSELTKWIHLDLRWSAFKVNSLSEYKENTLFTFTQMCDFSICTLAHEVMKFGFLAYTVWRLPNSKLYWPYWYRYVSLCELLCKGEYSVLYYWWSFLPGFVVCSLFWFRFCDCDPTREHFLNSWADIRCG